MLLLVLLLPVVNKLLKNYVYGGSYINIYNKLRNACLYAYDYVRPYPVAFVLANIHVA